MCACVNININSFRVLQELPHTRRREARVAALACLLSDVCLGRGDRGVRPATSHPPPGKPSHEPTTSVEFMSLPRVCGVRSLDMM